MALADGPHRLELVTRPAASVLEMLAPAAASGAGSSWTDESLAFDVVP